MQKIFIGTIAALFSLVVMGQSVIYQKDYSKLDAGTAIYKNCKAKKFDSGYYSSIGRIGLSKVKSYSKLTLKLNVAVSGGAELVLRAIPYKRGKKLTPFSLGRWKKLSPEYQTLTINFSLDEKVKTDVEKIISITPVLYRQNKKGTIWLKSIELTVSTKQKLESTAVLLDELKKKLVAEGFNCEVENNRLTAIKPGRGTVIFQGSRVKS